MLEVRIASGVGEPTGPKLVQDLAELGVDVVTRMTQTGSQNAGVTARVLWGTSGINGSSVPQLNAKASTYNKLQELQRFHSHHIPAPELFEEIPSDEDAYPILARQSTHAEGRDIKLVNSPAEAVSVYASYFTRVIPSSAEYRVWVFRSRALATYAREQTWPVQRQGFGRNWWNGYGYTLVSDIETASDYAKQAIAANGLDFGAVDILLGNDRRYYVLEVNTAPGATTYCQRARYKLAEEIKRWYEGI